MFKKIQKLDTLVLRSVKKLHSRPLNRIISAITYLGNGGLVWFAISLPMIISHDLRGEGVNLLFALLITLIMGEGIIKHIVCRIRPSETLPDSEQIIRRPKYYSFPSGHTASGFAAAAVTIATSPVWLFVPVLILAFLIGFSRIYLRVHYLTDVVVGCALGLVCGFASVPLFNLIISTIGVSF